MDWTDLYKAEILEYNKYNKMIVAMEYGDIRLA